MGTHRFDDLRGVNLSNLMRTSWQKHVENNFDKGVYQKPCQFLVSPFIADNSFYTFLDEPMNERDHAINMYIIRELSEAYNIFLDYIDYCKSSEETEYYARAGNASDSYLKFVQSKCYGSPVFAKNNRLNSRLCCKAYQMRYNCCEH